MIIINQQLLCGASVLYLQGPLRVPVGSELRRNVKALLRRGGRRILLDLSRVPALDAGGLGALIEVYTMTVAAQGVLRIVDTTPRVREILDRSGLLDRFTGGTGRWSSSLQPTDRVA
jgi:anti-anti-sigma factor